ncbi:ABC-type amino acid transport substrate-binding protein [Variovorax sp. TBS-050B]|uniref:amino acid ABC transporter substrate-binding protein n=1 Tax=Variovorax sp. TBS-050B TaxID=2940551 RepID=UPI0024732143|nr:amino acid ABC transporter substrate-binding protein [Variovorax sp. TBS-050B]MDH6593060.1 ABC-type amino acid transport substrate-binding protein [Variovorax sp. TBS-050B]
MKPAAALRSFLAGMLAAAALGALPVAVQAQQLPPETLTGTLAKAREAGSVAIGYRASSVPFSFLDPRGQPVGYSIELCRALVTAMEDAVHRPLAIRWVPVTSDSRLEAVESGAVDLECGSTTNNLERQKRVSFSPTIFVSGTKVLVRKGSPIRSFRDLAGRRVAVTAGTTNEKALRELSQRFALAIDLRVTRDHADGFALVKSGQADAFATDDVLLYGLLAQEDARAGYEVVGDYLSYDPYGIVYRKGDPQLAKVVNDAFQVLAQDGEIERQYKRWFLRKLPTGTRIDLPMSAQLRAIIETMAVKAAE